MKDECISNLAIEVIRQMCLDLEKINNGHHKLPREIKEEKEIIDSLNDLGLSWIVDKILVDHKKVKTEAFTGFSGDMYLPPYNTPVQETLKRRDDVRNNYNKGTKGSDLKLW